MPKADIVWPKYRELVIAELPMGLIACPRGCWQPSCATATFEGPDGTLYPVRPPEGVGIYVMCFTCKHKFIAKPELDPWGYREMRYWNEHPEEAYDDEVRWQNWMMQRENET